MRVPKREPTLPGEVFRCDVLEPLKLSVTEAAKRLKVSRQALSSVLNGGDLSLDMAKRWALATNTTAESWYNMQVVHDLWALQSRPIEVDSLLEAV